MQSDRVEEATLRSLSHPRQRERTLQGAMVLQDLGRRLNQAIQSVGGQSTIDEQVRGPLPPRSSTSLGHLAEY